MEDAADVAGRMAAFRIAPATQIAQTRFRQRLVDGWRIPEGARVLEVGCGQGDLTAVLARAVGELGSVTAVDIAGRGYGSPVTLGDSADQLSRSDLGPRIDFRFEFDPTTTDEFWRDAFDYVVLAHCSWYFSSPDRFRNTLRAVRPWAGRLCYSEWDMEPRRFDQVAHLLAVLIQGQVEAHRADGVANIRTPLSVPRVEQLLRETGWDVSHCETVESDDLQDATWEVRFALDESMRDAGTLGLPSRLVELLNSQGDILASLASAAEARSLHSVSILASRLAGPPRTAGDDHP